MINFACIALKNIHFKVNISSISYSLSIFMSKILKYGLLDVLDKFMPTSYDTIIISNLFQQAVVGVVMVCRH